MVNKVKQTSKKDWLFLSVFGKAKYDLITESEQNLLKPHKKCFSDTNLPFEGNLDLEPRMQSVDTHAHILNRNIL